VIAQGKLRFGTIKSCLAGLSRIPLLIARQDGLLQVAVGIGENAILMLVWRKCVVDVGGDY